MIKTHSAQHSQSRDTALRGLPDHHNAMHRSFTWHVDEHFNIAEVCCNRWARADAQALAHGANAPNAPNAPNAIKNIAIKVHQPSRSSLFYTYIELSQAAAALSHVLADLGVQRGDRVAIVMAQRFETAAAYMAVLQMGAVAMPLSVLFGPEALAFRLQDSAAVVAVCDGASLANINAVRADCRALRRVIAVGVGADTNTHTNTDKNAASDDTAAARANVDYAAATAKHQRAFTAVKTKADDPAILIYTSGTTGAPKGALLPHRALLGNLPGFVCSQNWFGFDGVGNQESNAIFWSPADWAWTGGLMDALLPTLYFGRPIVAFNGRFSPDLAFGLMATQGVTHTFLFPTALKAMMKAYPTPSAHFQLKLHGLMSAGEAVGDAVFDYCRDQLGVVVNEMFGQTEVNYIVGNCAMNRVSDERCQPSVWPSQAEPATATATATAIDPALADNTSVGHKAANAGVLVGWPAKPGSMGKAYPGHWVAVIDDDGNECPVGVPGDVAVNRFDLHGAPNPIFFLGYWKNQAASQAKFTGDWFRTGDLARRDGDGYLWYEGRADDVFKAAGYRIGPGEVENCLVKHPAVANAAVVPKPDAARGAVVKAYVVLAPDFIAARASTGCRRAQFDADLTASLQAHVKRLLAPYEYPKDIEFVDALPMTTTGKVQRRVLRLQEQERFRAASERA